MQGFVRIAQGVDMLPLRLAVERQEGIFDSHSSVVLFGDGEWKGEFFAFPQLRSLLLDVMRRVECGELKSIAIVRTEGVEKIGPLSDASCAIVGLMVTDGAVQGAGPLSMGDVFWASGASPLIFSQVAGFAVLVIFAPIP